MLMMAKGDCHRRKRVLPLNRLHLFQLSVIAICLQVTQVYSASSRVFHDLDPSHFCFRRLNYTHEFGCGSDFFGNVGIVHWIKDDANGGADDIDYVLASGPDAGGYVPVLNDSSLSRELLEKFVDSGRVNGLIILNSTHPLRAWSTDDKCPNRYSSYYYKQALAKLTSSAKRAELASKSSQTSDDSCSIRWNPENPMREVHLRSWPFPIFLLKKSTSVVKLNECFNQFNLPFLSESSSTRRKCAVRLRSQMSAAKDSATCMRKSELGSSQLTGGVSFCDPLGGNSIIAMLKPLSEVAAVTNGSSSSSPKAPNAVAGNGVPPILTDSTDSNAAVYDKSIVLVMARLDTFSMFDEISPGADSAVSGIVTLMSVADSLNKAAPNVDLKRNVMFALFNGEAFDYIGSSRFIYDIQKQKFPLNISLSSFSHILEINQVFPNNPAKDEWFIHVDPNQYNDSTQTGSIQDMVKILQASYPIQNKPAAIQGPNVSIELPPSSIQSFLKVEAGIPSIAITNFDQEFRNKFYNSLYDTEDHMNIRDLGTVTESLGRLATALSRTVLQLALNKSASTADPKVNEHVKVDNGVIRDLLECYLLNATCSFFHSVVNSGRRMYLREKPHTLYVSVPNSASPGVILSYLSLFKLTGTRVENVSSAEECTKLRSSSAKQQVSFTWMFGNSFNASNLTVGECWQSSSNLTVARSPFFEKDSETSGNGNGARKVNEADLYKWSTWTESVWATPSLELFVQPSRRYEIISLVSGISIFIFSLLLTFLMWRNADEIFESGSTPVAC